MISIWTTGFSFRDAVYQHLNFVYESPEMRSKTDGPSSFNNFKKEDQILNIDYFAVELQDVMHKILMPRTMKKYHHQN